MTEACTQVFMLVGQGFALGGAGEQTPLGCGLPSVPGLLGGSEVANTPLMVSPAPQPVDYVNVEGAAALARAHPDAGDEGRDHAAELPRHDRLHRAGHRHLPDGGVGVPRLHPDRIRSPVSPTSGHFLQKLKDCGAEVVFTTDTAANFENQLDTANQIDFHPIWMATSSLVRRQLRQLGTRAARRRRLLRQRLRTARGHHPRHGQRGLRRHRPPAGGDTSYTGQQSASAFLLWATAAQACGNDLTRDCVMQRSEAGPRAGPPGASAPPQDPGGNKPGDCGLVLRVPGHGLRAVAAVRGAGQLAWATTRGHQGRAAQIDDLRHPLKVSTDRLARNVTG